MGAKLRPIGMLKKYIHGKDHVDVSSGIPVSEALQTNGIPSELVAGVIVNGDYQYKDYVIKENDVVQVIAVIGGG
jgi:sulfur carrier protein ThiS